jgi:hypothetical protein
MEPIQKHQLVRVIDVVWIGPLMLYAGRKGSFSPFVKNSLIVFGVLTVIYNAYNFYAQRQKQWISS